MITTNAKSRGINKILRLRLNGFIRGFPLAETSAPTADSTIKLIVMIISTGSGIAIAAVASIGIMNTAVKTNSTHV